MRLQSLNPTTLEIIGDVELCAPEDVRPVIDAVRGVQPDWAKMTLARRSLVLRRAAQFVADAAEELADLLTAESGKTHFEALAAEVLPTAESLRWLARHTPELLAPERVRHLTPLFKAKHSYLRFEPLGVVGVISPWNYPLAIPAMQIAFAIAAGNGVVCKPSEFTPLIAERFVRLLCDAGVPEGLVRLVHGHGEVGAAVVAGKPDHLVFTGSVPTGRKIAATAGALGISVTLELGGKDPMLVRSDAPLDRAVSGAIFGGFFNAGQTCASVERIYVHQSISGEFIDRLVKRASAMRVGDPSLPGTQMGPMIHATARRTVERHVDDALRAGAQMLCGGPLELQGLRGAFYAPTVLAGVPDDAAVMREETFGPVLPVRVIDSDEEAIALANASEFGLTASVWTRNIDTGERVAARLEAGTVFVNDVLYAFASPDVPWGGRKSSGSGRTHSPYGLHELVQIKHVSIQRAWMPPIGYPASKHWTPAIQGVLQAIYSDNHRLRGVRRALASTLRAMTSRRR